MIEEWKKEMSFGPSSKLFVIVVSELEPGLPVVLQTLQAAMGIERTPVLTTRRFRGGDADGADYRRVSGAEFHRLRRCGAFLDVFEYDGDLFGIRSQDVYELAHGGRSFCVPLRPDAANRLKAAYPDRVVRIRLRHGLPDSGHALRPGDYEFAADTTDLSHALFDIMRRVEPLVDRGWIEKD